jgi:hypothetical protein
MMTTKTKPSSIALVTAAFTSAMLIAGGASAKPAQAFHFKHVSIANSGNLTGNRAALARAAAPVAGFKRALVETSPPAPAPMPVPMPEPFPKPGDLL